MDKFGRLLNLEACGCGQIRVGGRPAGEDPAQKKNAMGLFTMRMEEDAKAEADAKAAKAAAANAPKPVTQRTDSAMAYFDDDDVIEGAVQQQQQQPPSSPQQPHQIHFRSKVATGR